MDAEPPQGEQQEPKQRFDSAAVGSPVPHSNGARKVMKPSGSSTKKKTMRKPRNNSLPLPRYSSGSPSMRTADQMRWRTSVLPQKW